MDVRTLAGLVAAVGTGAFAGVMLAIGLILGAYWRSLPAQEFLDWFAVNGHLVGRIIPLVAAPSILGVAAALWLGWAGPARMIWLVALAALALIFIITFTYHLPANAAFAAKSVPLTEVSERLTAWLRLHYVRIALGLIAAISSAIAMTR